VIHGGSMVVFKSMTQKVRVAVERLLRAGLRAVSVIPNGHKPHVFVTLVSCQEDGEPVRSDYDISPEKLNAVMEQVSLSTGMYAEEENKYLFVSAVSDSAVNPADTDLPWGTINTSIEEHKKRGTK